MKLKKVCSIMLVLSLLLGLPVLGLAQETLEENGAYTGKGSGYGGEMEVEVTFEDGKITDMKILSSHESSPVIGRAFEVIKERIIDAQSPVVDSVTSATFSSYAIKAAVAQAGKEYGLDFGEITFSTTGPEVEVKEAEAVTADLVIVGGGPAGLAAAIEAKENGVENIILIEKLDILSGNGKFDMNFFDIVNTQAQKANGVEDSADKFYEDKVGKVTDSDERVRVWADGAATVDGWLRGMGVELNHNYGGRSHMAEENRYSGEAIQDGLEAKVKELGIDVRTGTKGLDIISDEQGAVLGIKVENKTERYDILAKAVIMATGGFSANKELLAQYAPGAERVETSNSMGAVGDFVQVFIDKGYKMDDMDVLSIFKMINVPNRELTGAGDGFILVNNQGERFVDESSSGLPFAHAILDQANSEVYYIYDQRLHDSFYRLQKHNNLGYHTKADTLEELAEALGIPAEALVNSVEGYNSAIKGEGADPFREKTFTEPFNMDGPFYGARVQAAIHMTKGGVVANEKAQVLTEEGEVVPNLYAAGEVTSTAAAYAGAVIWGREAGKQAAAQISE